MLERALQEQDTGVLVNFSFGALHCASPGPISRFAIETDPASLICPPKGTQVFVWEELGAQVDRIEDAIEAQSGEDTLVMGLDNYNMTSALAFYRTKANRGVADPRAAQEGMKGTVGRHVLGKQDPMDRYGSNAAACEGRIVLLVAETAAALTAE